MANIKSQKKRIRQDEKKNLRNKDKKTALRSSIKAILNSESDVEKEQILLSVTRISVIFWWVPAPKVVGTKL